MRLGELRDGFYLWSHCGILVIDLTSRRACRDLAAWYEDFIRVCNNIPVVICGNKIDVRKRRRTNLKVMKTITEKNLPYCEVSVKTNYNTEKPFLWLTRKLLGDETLTFVPPPAVIPPEIHMDPRIIEQYEMEIAENASTILPDDDDDLTISTSSIK